MIKQKINEGNRDLIFDYKTNEDENNTRFQL